MEKEEYISSIEAEIEKEVRFNKRLAILWIILFIVLIFEYALVYFYDIIGMPYDIAYYMMFKKIFEFNLYDFIKICGESINGLNTICLILVYYTSFLFMALYTFLFGFLTYRIGIKYRTTREKNTYIM